jgi:hypothetical protein
MARLAFDKYLTGLAQVSDFQWSEMMNRLDEIYLVPTYRLPSGQGPDQLGTQNLEKK